MEFIAKVDKNGKLVFATSSMEKTWNRVISFYGNAGSYFKIEVKDHVPNSTEGQHKLYKRLCIMVSEETGQDYQTVNKEFLKLAPFKQIPGLFGQMNERNLSLEELNTKQFQEFLEKTLIKANEIMDTHFVMYTDEKLGTIITKKENY